MDGNLSNEEFQVGASALQVQLDELADLGGTVSEANGDLRSLIKQIVDEEGYHKRALGVIREIDKMSETKRADFLRTFGPMLDAMRAGKWDTDTTDMFDPAVAE
ncbi:hypothetical protein [Parasedimentitalea psychrophila]|uniref:Uncharacterized protein n=1 Tax=Parasedimentitalea psychrophila TaxID=2997337 RepID=A0A9Y2P049_9RHOB|nr:hypothetical protein [Parasedimentitalea psychrophila]WIY24241.1 hypothetical protein QPJ95_16785 [Parasedimentitalea psychrophila]